MAQSDEQNLDSLQLILSTEPSLNHIVYVKKHLISYIKYKPVDEVINDNFFTLVLNYFKFIKKFVQRNPSIKIKKKVVSWLKLIYFLYDKDEKSRPQVTEFINSEILVRMFNKKCKPGWFLKIVLETCNGCFLNCNGPHIKYLTALYMEINLANSFDTQRVVMESMVNYFTLLPENDLLAIAKTAFKDQAELFLEIFQNDISIGIRHFLNRLNHSRNKILSVLCLQIVLDTKILNSPLPNKQLWLDVNKTVQEISIYCTEGSLRADPPGTISEEFDSNTWELLTVPFKSIYSVNRRNFDKYQEIILELNLHGTVFCSYELSNDVINNTNTLLLTMQQDGLNVPEFLNYATFSETNVSDLKENNSSVLSQEYLQKRNSTRLDSDTEVERCVIESSQEVAILGDTVSRKLPAIDREEPIYLSSKYRSAVLITPTSTKSYPNKIVEDSFSGGSCASSLGTSIEIYDVCQESESTCNKGVESKLAVSQIVQTQITSENTQENICDRANKKLETAVTDMESLSCYSFAKMPKNRSNLINEETELEVIEIMELQNNDPVKVISKNTSVVETEMKFAIVKSNASQEIKSKNKADSEVMQTVGSQKNSSQKKVLKNAKTPFIADMEQALDPLTQFIKLLNSGSKKNMPKSTETAIATKKQPETDEISESQGSNANKNVSQTYAVGSKKLENNLVQLEGSQSSNSYKNMPKTASHTNIKILKSQDSNSSQKRPKSINSANSVKDHKAAVPEVFSNQSNSSYKKGLEYNDTTLTVVTAKLQPEATESIKLQNYPIKRIPEHAGSVTDQSFKSQSKHNNKKVPECQNFEAKYSNKMSLETTETAKELEARKVTQTQGSVKLPKNAAETFKSYYCNIPQKSIIEEPLTQTSSALFEENCYVKPLPKRQSASKRSISKNIKESEKKPLKSEEKRPYDSIEDFSTPQPITKFRTKSSYFNTDSLNYFTDTETTTRTTTRIIRKPKRLIDEIGLKEISRTGYETDSGIAIRRKDQNACKVATDRGKNNFIFAVPPAKKTLQGKCLQRMRDENFTDFDDYHSSFRDLQSNVSASAVTSKKDKVRSYHTYQPFCGYETDTTASYKKLTENIPYNRTYGCPDRPSLEMQKMQKLAVTGTSKMSWGYETDPTTASGIKKRYNVTSYKKEVKENRGVPKLQMQMLDNRKYGSSVKSPLEKQKMQKTAINEEFGGYEIDSVPTDGIVRHRYTTSCKEFEEHSVTLKQYMQQCLGYETDAVLDTTGKKHYGGFHSEFKHPFTASSAELQKVQKPTQLRLTKCETDSFEHYTVSPKEMKKRKVGRPKKSSTAASTEIHTIQPVKPTKNGTVYEFREYETDSAINEKGDKQNYNKNAPFTDYDTDTFEHKRQHYTASPKEMKKRKVGRPKKSSTAASTEIHTIQSVKPANIGTVYEFREYDTDSAVAKRLHEKNDKDVGQNYKKNAPVFSSVVSPAKMRKYNGGYEKGKGYETDSVTFSKTSKGRQVRTKDKGQKSRFSSLVPSPELRKMQLHKHKLQLMDNNVNCRGYETDSVIATKAGQFKLLYPSATEVMRHKRKRAEVDSDEEGLKEYSAFRDRQGNACQQSEFAGSQLKRKFQFTDPATQTQTNFERNATINNSDSSKRILESDDSDTDVTISSSQKKIAKMNPSLQDLPEQPQRSSFCINLIDNGITSATFQENNTESSEHRKIDLNSASTTNKPLITSKHDKTTAGNVLNFYDSASTTSKGPKKGLAKYKASKKSVAATDSVSETKKPPVIGEKTRCNDQNFKEDSDVTTSKNQKPCKLSKKLPKKASSSIKNATSEYSRGGTSKQVTESKVAKIKPATETIKAKTIKTGKQNSNAGAKNETMDLFDMVANNIPQPSDLGTQNKFDGWRSIFDSDSSIERPIKTLEKSNTADRIKNVRIIQNEIASLLPSECTSRENMSQNSGKEVNTEMRHKEMDTNYQKLISLSATVRQETLQLYQKETNVFTVLQSCFNIVDSILKMINDVINVHKKN